MKKGATTCSSAKSVSEDIIALRNEKGSYNIAYLKKVIKKNYSTAK